MLREAAHSDDPVELAVLHDLIKDLTGGKIVASQQGERKPHQGWVRLTLHVRVLDVLARRCGLPEVKGDVTKVEIDVARPDWKDEMCEKVKDRYDAGLLEKDIAEELHLHRSQVSMLLKHWAKKHDQTLPDGRKRRATLARKQQKTPGYEAIANDVKALWDDPAIFSVVEIGRRLGTNDTMAWKALAWWHRIRGCPCRPPRTGGSGSSSAPSRCSWTALKSSGSHRCWGTARGGWDSCSRRPSLRTGRRCRTGGRAATARRRAGRFFR